MSNNEIATLRVLNVDTMTQRRREAMADWLKYIAEELRDSRKSFANYEDVFVWKFCVEVLPMNAPRSAAELRL